MNRIITITLVITVALLSAGTAGAQSKLDSKEWKTYKRYAEQYDSLQAVFQKMVESDPELQKNPSLLQERIKDDMKEINAIYQGVGQTAGPALETLEGDFSAYPVDDLQLIKMAAIAARKVELAVKANEQLLETVQDPDSARAMRLELAKYHSFLGNLDEAAKYGTADVLANASDQDKLQFYPALAKGYANEGDYDKAMLYAFKAMETYEQYRTATAKQLEGTEKEEQEVKMMNNYFMQQYVALLSDIAWEMREDEKLKESFFTESQNIVGDEKRWGAIATQVDLKLTEKQAESERLDSPAPEWAAHDWMNGDPLSLEKLKGKVVLVDFFATWCKPCIMAFPHIREWQEKYADDGLIIAGLTTYQGRYKGKEVSPEEEAEKMKNDFIEDHEITWPVGIESEGNDTFKDYGVQGIPYVVLIDREGKLRYTKTGATGYEETEAMIKQLLAEE